MPMKELSGSMYLAQRELEYNKPSVTRPIRGSGFFSEGTHRAIIADVRYEEDAIVIVWADTTGDKHFQKMSLRAGQGGHALGYFWRAFLAGLLPNLEAQKAMARLSQDGVRRCLVGIGAHVEVELKGGYKVVESKGKFIGVHCETQEPVTPWGSISEIDKWAADHGLHRALHLITSVVGAKNAVEVFVRRANVYLNKESQRIQSSLGPNPGEKPHSRGDRDGPSRYRFVDPSVHRHRNNRTRSEER